MRSKYKWYLEPTKAEEDDVWNNGILSVDANVLLDLYRYHSSTRDELLGSLNKFEGRLWLSHQAAEEFVRNRKQVIASAEKTFIDAHKVFENVQKSLASGVNELRSHRLIERHTIENLEKSVHLAIELAVSDVISMKDKHPNYLKNDAIFDRILALFEGAVGDAPDKNEYKRLCDVAEGRLKTKTPPGYLDGDKQSDRAYGDFLMWHQVISHAKEIKRPIIFVTAEEKDDWWEGPSGRRLGPRQELLREAYEVSGQRVYIFQRVHFLKLQAGRGGTKVPETAVSEIQEVSESLKRKSLPAQAPIERALERKNSMAAIQTVGECSPTLHSGVASIRLTRLSYIEIGVFLLSPAILGEARITIDYISGPIPEQYIEAAVAISDHGSSFSIFVKSPPNGAALPAGDYSFLYRVESNQSEEGIS